MRRPAQRYVLIGNQVRLRSNGCSPASIRAAMSAAGPQPGDLVRVAGEQDREPAADVASCPNVAGGGDEDHLVSSQIAVRPPSTWMIAPLM
jgi:hypothetical protein